MEHTCLTLDGTGQLHTTDVFLGSVETPSLEIIWPKQVTFSETASIFEMTILVCDPPTFQKLALDAGGVSQNEESRLLLHLNRSRVTHEPAPPRHIFIKCWKVAGTLLKPIRIHPLKLIYDHENGKCSLLLIFWVISTFQNSLARSMLNDRRL